MSQTTPEAIIRIRKLRNCFGTQCVHVDLDLDVRRGEILGVVGGSVPANPFCCAASLVCVAQPLARSTSLVRI